MPAFLTRALRFLPQEIARQVLPDGCHAERSPAAQLAALQDLTEIRALLQAAQAQPPPALAGGHRAHGGALRLLRHGDGSSALFNGSKEDAGTLVELVLTQAGRGGRAADARCRTAASSACKPGAASLSWIAARRRRWPRPQCACRHSVDGDVGRPRPADRELRRVSGRPGTSGATRYAPPPRIRRW